MGSWRGYHPFHRFSHSKVLEGFVLCKSGRYSLSRLGDMYIKGWGLVMVFYRFSINGVLWTLYAHLRTRPSFFAKEHVYKVSLRYLNFYLSYSTIILCSNMLQEYNNVNFGSEIKRRVQDFRSISPKLRTCWRIWYIDIQTDMTKSTQIITSIIYVYTYVCI